VLVVQWNDKKSPETLVWGYKWDGKKYGYEMIDEIAEADDRFFYLRFYSGKELGYAIAGMGFEDSGKNNVKIDNSGTCETEYFVMGACAGPTTPNRLRTCESPTNGSIDADPGYDFDYWIVCNGANSARWQAGWYEAYWSYWVANNFSDNWEFSGFGASSSQLKNNSVNAWYYDIDLNDEEKSTFMRCYALGEDCDGKEFFGKNITPVMPPNN